MRQPTRFLAVLLSLGPAIGGCARDAGPFSVQNARAHVEMLAGTIGSRPVGTAANSRARDYIVRTLSGYGLDVRVQETDGRRAEIGRTARVHNIIATLPGTRPEAVGVLAHYDSSPSAPGAADDGLGVAAALEIARVIAARQARTWTLLVLITDAEEAGLLGAAGLMTDRDVRDRLRAYVNIEATGSGAPSVLFQTGPGNPWLTSVWAAEAPRPRGGSYGFEIYKRLPNDTDFTILAQQDIPGLNVAAVGDSYAYHTARDTVERLSDAVLRDTGDNAVAIVGGLERLDITARSSGDATFFDVAGRAGVAYGMLTAWAIGLAAAIAGAVAWVRVTAFVLRAGGIVRWTVTALWAVAVSLAVVVSMAGTTWALRASREVYHPWYARPDRLLFLLVAVGAAVAWSGVRARAWLPAGLRERGHPATAWSVTLPVWIGVAVAMVRVAPAASYLWTIPLLTAAILLAIVPLANGLAVRLAAVLVFAVSSLLWLNVAIDLFRFLAALFGRLPVVTPAYVYAGVLAAAAMMIAPPVVSATAGLGPMPQPRLVTASWLIVVVVAAGMAYAAPAYTHHEPLRRTVRALQEPGGTTATWEIGSVEPGIDLGEGAPAGWSRPNGAVRTDIPWGSLSQPFVFRTSGPSLGPAPLEIAGLVVEPVAAGVELALTVVPKREGLWVSFVLPSGTVPVRSNLPGVMRLNHWTATFVAPPPGGVIWRASFKTLGDAAIQGVRLGVTDFGFPDGAGWQRLPSWLPQDRAVWSATATWVVQLPVASFQPPANGPGR